MEGVERTVPALRQVLVDGFKELRGKQKHTNAEEKGLRADLDRLRKEMDDLNARENDLVERERKAEELERGNEKTTRIIAGIKHGDPNELENYGSHVQNMILDVGGKEFGPVWKNDFIKFPSLLRNLKAERDRVFVDRDPAPYDAIVGFLNNSVDWYPHRDTKMLEQVRAEADFLQFNALTDALNDPPPSPPPRRSFGAPQDEPRRGGTYPRESERGDYRRGNSPHDEPGPRDRRPGAYGPAQRDRRRSPGRRNSGRYQPYEGHHRGGNDWQDQADGGTDARRHADAPRPEPRDEPRVPLRRVDGTGRAPPELPDRRRAETRGDARGNARGDPRGDPHGNLRGEPRGPSRRGAPDGDTPRPRKVFNSGARPADDSRGSARKGYGKGSARPLAGSDAPAMLERPPRRGPPPPKDQGDGRYQHGERKGGGRNVTWSAEKRGGTGSRGGKQR